MRIGLFVNLFVCLLLTLPESATDITLPTPSGPYSVGTKSFMVEDSSRHAFRGKGPNRWMVQAYYPSQPHTDKHSYMPGTLQDSMVSGVRVYAHAHVDASFHEDSGRPLILFIPGLGGERQKYTILCEELASQGWAVLALDTPYVSNFVRFEKGDTTVLTFKDAWNVPRDRDYRYQYYDEAMRHVMGNVDYILTHLDSINNSQLSGTIDTSTIILMGHSFGGNVAHSFGFQDPRIKAVVDIDSKITERPINGQVGVPSNLGEKPVLFIRGNLQYQEDVGTQLSQIPSATIWTPDVQHSAFSDNGYLAGKIEKFGRRNNLSDLYHWFFKTGPVWDNIDTDLGSYTVDEWYVIYRTYIVDWLEKYLKGEYMMAKALSTTPTPYLQKRESEGYVVYDITCDPHKKWDVAILDIMDTEYHVHKVGHEHFTVLTGMLEIWTDDKTQTLSPGQSIDIFPGVVHKLKSARDEPVRVICTCFPAFDPNDLYVVHKD